MKPTFPDLASVSRHDCSIPVHVLVMPAHSCGCCASRFRDLYHLWPRVRRYCLYRTHSSRSRSWYSSASPSDKISKLRVHIDVIQSRFLTAEYVCWCAFAIPCCIRGQCADFLLPVKLRNKELPPNANKYSDYLDPETDRQALPTLLLLLLLGFLLLLDFQCTKAFSFHNRSSLNILVTIFSTIAPCRIELS